MGDKVNHPDHYQNIAGLEAIDILDDIVKDLPGKQAAMLWNTLKYLFRFQKKNGVEDLKKAQNYLQRLIDDIESDKAKPKNNSKSSKTKKKVEAPWGMWHSKEYGDIIIWTRSSDPNGMPSKLTFDTESAATEFKDIFYRMISDGHDEFSIADWDNMLNGLSIEIVNGRYALIFNYKDSSSETPKPVDTTYGPCVIYDSKISGKAEVHYSMQMFAGTCTTIVFTSELARDLFINSFLNKLGKKRFSIRDVLNDTNFIVPSTADTFIVKMPWRDLFAKFKMRCEKGKFLLDFIYKQETFESLIKQPTNDEHILYKSTVWGSADVYYSTDMPQGTCTKILFDDEGGRNTFAIKFFRYLSTGAHSFSIQDILEDSKFMFPKEDNSLHFTMPWNEIFKGFHMTDEAGKYALEFIPDFALDLDSEKETEVDNDLKAKVDKAIIIVTGTKEEPYFEILYHLIGESEDRIGFGSYCLTNVFNWRDQYLEIVNKEDK